MTVVARILAVLLGGLMLFAGAAESGETEKGAAQVREKSVKEILFGSIPLGRADLDWEADLYYSNVSLNIPLTTTPIQSLSGQPELEIYSRLFLDSLVPRYLLIEVAVMPLPLTGVALKKVSPDFYSAADIGSDQNLIQWITAGFEEPYAASVFFGTMARFSREGEARLSSNKGYMGYLLSYSNQHIRNNVLVHDHSLEAEWKMKGERSFREEKLSWSFRFGAKLHGNPAIADTLYAGFRRSDLDFRANPIDFLKNSTIDMRWDIGIGDGELLRQEYVLGKKFPIKSWGVAIKLDAGVIWEAAERYRGGLREGSGNNLTVLLRPNLIF